jgi:hypothetical protein
LGEGNNLVRAYVERLETALAAATHERDLAAEKGRLAGEGVAGLEQRLGELRQRLDRERGEAERELERHAEEAERRLAQAGQEKEKELAAARERLEAREKHLANAKAGIEARDRRLEVATEKLEAWEAELKAQGKELDARGVELKQASAALEAQRTEAAVARARLELREEELARSQATAHEAQRELATLRERLGESERELAVRERDLAARVRELGQAGEELIGREHELELAAERLAERERELEAASTLLETQGAELARARDDAREATRALDEAREEAQSATRERDEAREEAQSAGRERDEAREEAQSAARERDEAGARLEAREKHLANAKAGIEARDRRLEVAERAGEKRDADLGSREAELQRLRVVSRDRERKLALAEARLEKAQQRAEHFRGSLVELREGRAYRLMRVLWRLRRPFRRRPKDTTSPSEPAAGGDEAEPASPRAAGSPPERLRVASILDEMSAACFAPECELVPLRLADWAEQLDEQRPDLLLVESAWNGNGGEWQYRIAQYPRKDLAGLPALRALLDGCRQRGIPTAFWNKEDPVHFERFAEAAARFDHVFTTDARCVERYRALPGERTVSPLPFAAQPRIHNPVAAVPERSPSPCFAGAWYRDRHPDRRAALEALLDAARPYGLVIYDRRFGADDDAFGFPGRFAPHVLGKLPYERVLDVYRSHRVFLNANSVVDSPTMCSRRVFELAACDTAILSTPGAALSTLLGRGLVEEAGEEGEAAAALGRLLGDEEERRRRARAARRKVFAEHTYAERLATIAEVAGLDASTLRREPFAVPGEAANGHPWQLHLQPGTSLGAPAIADLAAAANFAEAGVIGAHPAANGAAPIEHRHVDDLDPRVLLLSRDLIESRGHPSGSAEQIQAQLRQWSDEGIRLYAADADLLAPSSPLIAG